MKGKANAERAERERQGRQKPSETHLKSLEKKTGVEKRSRRKMERKELKIRLAFLFIFTCASIFFSSSAPRFFSRLVAIKQNK